MKQLNALRKWNSLFIIPCALALSVGCGDDDDDTSPPESGDETPDDDNPPPSSGPAPVEENPDVALADVDGIGNVLVDEDGVVLYFFSDDVGGDSACEDACLDSWPVFHTASPQFGEGLEESEFGEINRTDGLPQTTYKGWPLYYFAPDGDGVVESAGGAQGEGRGDVWYVAKPDYTIMIGRTQLVGADGENYAVGEAGDVDAGEGQSRYFVDAEGNSLYIFAPDFNGVNTFTADDFSNNDVWPIYEETLDQIPSTLDAEDFGTVSVAGRTQLSYRGYPLYFFGGTATVEGDSNRGDTRGVSVPMPGVWPVASDRLDVAETPAVQLGEVAELGAVLTDSQGRTLYFFSSDVAGESTCSEGCQEAWPVFDVGEGRVGSGLDESDFGEVTAPGGSAQSTFRGWPLYYFAPPVEEGERVIEPACEANGDGVGGVWYVAKPDYGLMIGQGQLIGADGENYVVTAGDYTVGEGATTYFTDAEGRTVYYFTNDSRNTNTFTSDNLTQNAIWPVFFADASSLPSGMAAGEFDQISVTVGEDTLEQLTYRGWPLYYFGSDANRGDTLGVSQPNPGVWPIVNNVVSGAPAD
ncbi:MAG: hypothetical protein AAF605_05540 [Myxococcota bacterium]